MGITGDRVPLGSHRIYFWESEHEFARGVRFFYPGLRQGEHCIAFGHDEALDRVQQVLRSEGYAPEQLQRCLIQCHDCARIGRGVETTRD